MSNRNAKQSILLALILAAVPMVASATVITVQTVPWIATAPATPHYSWDGDPNYTLKGVTNVQGTTIQYDWNPGDGTAHCTGTVTNMYNVSCAHTYTYVNGATLGNTFSATLTVWDSSTGTEATATNKASANYFTEIYQGPNATAGNPNAASPNLPIEVNAAIDSGLWYLHTTATHVVNSQWSGGPGSGASFSVTTDDTNDATVGQITHVTINSGGSGYVAPVTLVVTDGYCQFKVAPYYVQPCGSGFAATVGLTGGVVTSVTITNPGQNYNLIYPSAGDYYPSDQNTATLQQGTLSTTSVIDWAGNNPGGVTATFCQAFEVSGHLQNGPASDPYTADVAGCLAAVFSVLQTTTVTGTLTNTHGTYTTDQNGNGKGVHIVDGASEDQYQAGMPLDAITASGTPCAPVTVGPLAALTHPVADSCGAVGSAYTYGDAVADIADNIAYCSYNGGSASTQGSWHYDCQESTGDNSVAQWNAIGLISAVRDFGKTVPTNLLQANQDWIATSQAAGFSGNGYFGYNGSSPLWGPYADTPAGMVQMAMNGIGRSPTATCCTSATNSAATRWDWAETFMRDNFDNPQTGEGSSNDVKDYYYGMYSLTKSMLYYNGTGTIPTTQSFPLQYLGPSLDNAAKGAIDWYAAQTAAYGGTDTSNGVARTLLSGTPANSVPGQNADGHWVGVDYDGSSQDQFATGWAIIMLNRTVTVLLPSACASSLSGTNDTSLQLNGGCSTDANPNAHIVTWEWDVTCTAGTNFTVTGVNPFNLFNVNPNLLPYACPVRLRVIDSVGNTSDYVFNVNLTAAAGDDPPVANAGGPYNFCPNLTPWNLSASLSTNPGVDTITSYGWDYGDNCANNDSSNTATPYSDSTAIQPRVDTGTNNLLGFSPGAYCVKVKVTNNKGYTNVASGTVNILSANSVNCTNCVQQPAGEAKNAAPGSPGDAQLYWADTNSAALPFDHYNIYRSTDNFVTHTQIAGANGIYPAIPAPTGAKLYGGTQLVFVDGTAATAQTYYYRISPATIADQDTCSSPITVAVTVKAAR